MKILRRKAVCEKLGGINGVPYGGLPRPLLAWICTEAVRTGSPDLSHVRLEPPFFQSLDLHNDG